MEDIWKRLRAPFKFDDLEVMPKSINSEGTKALCLLYVNARAVMERLDEVFTPSGWRVEYRDCHIGANVSGIICKLTVWADGEEVVREDGCDSSDIEAFKGAISGALKRAFTSLGCRYLYEIELGWLDCEHYVKGDKKYFKRWTESARKKMVEAYNAQVKQIFNVELPKTPPKSEPQDLGNEAWDFLKSIGVSSEADVKTFKANAKAKNADWKLVALAAKAEGVEDAETLTLFVQGMKGAA